MTHREDELTRAEGTRRTNRDCGQPMGPDTEHRKIVVRVTSGDGGVKALPVCTDHARHIARDHVVVGYDHPVFPPDNPRSGPVVARMNFYDAWAEAFGKGGHRVADRSRYKMGAHALCLLL